MVTVLQGLRKPLKLGYVMVKNRSQKQIDDGVTLAEAKVAEDVWFKNHAHFGALARDSRAHDTQSSFGVDALSTRLTELLVDRIQHVLPELSAEVATQLDVHISELNQLSVAPPTDTKDMQKALMQMVSSTIGTVSHASTGTYEDNVFLNENMRMMARIRSGPSEPLYCLFSVAYTTIISSLMPTVAFCIMLYSYCYQKIGCV